MKYNIGLLIKESYDLSNKYKHIKYHRGLWIACSVPFGFCTSRLLARGFYFVTYNKLMFYYNSETRIAVNACDLKDNQDKTASLSLGNDRMTFNLDDVSKGFYRLMRNRILKADTI